MATPVPEVLLDPTAPPPSELGGGGGLLELPPGAFWINPGGAYPTYGVMGPGNQVLVYDHVSGMQIGMYDAGGGGAGARGLTPEELELEREALAIRRDELGETVRANLARESVLRRQTALDIAKSAVDTYMDATEQSRGGREAAFSEARSLLDKLVPAGQQYWSGLEPTGALATMAQRYGLSFEPTEVVHKQLTPALLATQPPVPPEVAYMMQGVMGTQEVT